MLRFCPVLRLAMSAYIYFEIGSNAVSRRDFMKAVGIGGAAAPMVPGLKSDASAGQEVHQFLYRKDGKLDRIVIDNLDTSQIL